VAEHGNGSSDEYGSERKKGGFTILSNEKVVERWADGIAANNGNMSSDGVDLYSYNLRIGKTIDERIGRKKVKGKAAFAYSSWKCIGYPVSVTTSNHVFLAFRHSDYYLATISAKNRPSKKDLLLKYGILQIGTIDGFDLFEDFDINYLTSTII